jgi:ABC-type bacteriocin/lantibiotic exporter with double-glycine peptidase domain
MNNVEATVASPLAKDDLQTQFVDGAVHKLAAAVSSRERTVADEPGRDRRSLTRALSRVLEHFGCAVDEMSLAVAARGGDVDAVVRGVCEQNQLHVREVELRPDDARTFGAPVLAFRGSEAVVLMPGTWRKWSELGDRAARKDNFQQRAFTFYRSLGTEPMGLREFWRIVFAPESKRDLAFAVACGIVAAVLSAISVYLMQSLVEWALPQGDRSSLTLLASGWCVVALTASNLRLSRTLLQTRIGTRVDVGTEAALVGRALSLPLSEFKGRGSGDLSERIRDACQFGKVAYGTATDVALAGASALAFTAMLGTTSLRAALAIAAVMLLRAAVASVLLAGMYKDGARQAVARGAMSARLFELFSSISRIKVASAEARAFYQWATGFAKVRRAGYRGALLSGVLTATEGLFDVAGTLVLYAVCCRIGGDGKIEIGSFIVAAACLAGLQGAYSEVAQGMMKLLPLIPKAQRIRPILSAPAEVRSDAITPTTLDGNVSLRHVTFHYADDDVRILDNVSLDIKRGQFVAIVGPSGCGKSTLIKLILGFHAPSSGSVLLDGKDLANLDLRSVRRQIGAVLQGSELLPSSILFNIVGTTKRTVDDAWVAARRACIADDIEQMPMKMFTALSDRAVTISGGQKQRILIARALVREPKLLIFDEATSALDNQTQAGVMDALQEMDCTKICIAHRLSTVVHADLIVVMNKGTIVQEGTFESLMSVEGLFRTLVESQLESDKGRSGAGEPDGSALVRDSTSS